MSSSKNDPILQFVVSGKVGGELNRTMTTSAENVTATASDAATNRSITAGDDEQPAAYGRHCTVIIVDKLQLIK